MALGCSMKHARSYLKPLLPILVKHLEDGNKVWFGKLGAILPKGWHKSKRSNDRNDKPHINLTHCCLVSSILERHLTPWLPLTLACLLVLRQNGSCLSHDFHGFIRFSMTDVEDHLYASSFLIGNVFTFSHVFPCYVVVSILEVLCLPPRAGQATTTATFGDSREGFFFFD
ncbi:unnamed protein product [Symbiodinium natans]|uniref:Uncharacterized protein n=1 Tax=Symbiodinium natans TaxID=878477 RepID=A0A812TYQ6_9DINO|nr:unnamed protein product [Symbiodinium natans]